MATKTISVDLEAYEKLSRAKSSARESFSQVIKRAEWKPKKGTAAHILEMLNSPEGNALSDEALDELDRAQAAPRSRIQYWCQ